MSPAIVIADAGPALNFLACHQQKLLIAATGGKGALHMPQTVIDEINAKAANARTSKFEPAKSILHKLQENGYVTVLTDESSNSGLSQAVQDVVGVPLETRKSTPKDLGETMAIAHALALARTGEDVLLVIDDTHADMLLRRMDALLGVAAKKPGAVVGHIDTCGTLDLLARLAGTKYVPTKADMRAVFERMSPLDDGLPNEIKGTQLLKAEGWKVGRPNAK